MAKRKPPRLDGDKRKAFKQLEGWGFTFRNGKGGEQTLIAPDGTILGGFSLHSGRGTPTRLRARVSQWYKGTRGLVNG